VRIHKLGAIDRHQRTEVISLSFATVYVCGGEQLKDQFIMPYTEELQSEAQKKLYLQVEQLKLHRRASEKVSKTIKEMIAHCQNEVGIDPLVHPVKLNPFKEKRSCEIV